ncbi:kinase-like domain-containing protein [Thelephora terrestris]|uniref:Kinase-like domain-containing protein n=1 Tax=Thelephora terrestris TaxID=56493 RepID=A0A9P6H894_9AGAM|nr:kinase-like domain-containing protein [Thelephora terrestris]
MWPIRFRLPRFVRPTRPDPVLPVPNQDNIRPLPSSSGLDVQPDFPDRQTILSQWQQLGTLDPKSHGYVELLRTLVDVESNRNIALGFTDYDARVVINIIGEALRLRGGTLPRGLALHSFSMLRKLAGKTGQLPGSYLLNKDAGYQVEEMPFACGGFADVRKGKLGNRAVAVKTIRVSQDKDISKFGRWDFCKESVVWMHLSHPNVLELAAVDVDPENGIFSLISEFMVNGNIMVYIRTKEANRIRLLDDVTRERGDSSGVYLRLWFSTVAPTMSFAMSASADENKGTWSHMAPELLIPGNFGLHDARLSKQADIYAFGAVVYEVLTGTKGRVNRKTRRILGLVEALGNSSNGGWHQRRDERPTAEDIRKHFRRVARTSTVVPPGSAKVVREDNIDSPTVPLPSQTSMSKVQQFKFVAGVVAGGGSLHPAVSVPSAHFIRAAPSLFDRITARIKGRGPVPRLVAPTSPPARA